MRRVKIWNVIIHFLVINDHTKRGKKDLELFLDRKCCSWPPLLLTAPFINKKNRSNDEIKTPKSIRGKCTTDFEFGHDICPCNICPGHNCLPSRSTLYNILVDFHHFFPPILEMGYFYFNKADLRFWQSFVSFIFRGFASDVSRAVWE